MVFLSGMQQSKAQATQEYYVNLVLDRKQVSDDVWTETWQIFRDQYLPIFQGGAGTGKFDVQANDQRAIFQLSQAYTSNFPQTYAEFQKIPSMVPANEFFTVRVEGPYLGRPGSLGGDDLSTPEPEVYVPGGDLRINGRGDNETGTTVQRTVRAGGTWRVTISIQNDTDVAQRFKIEITGSMMRRNGGCKVRLFAGLNKGRIRKFRNKYIYTTPVLRSYQALPVNFYMSPAVVPRKYKSSRAYTADIVSAPAVLGGANRAKLICIVRNGRAAAK